MKRFPPFLRQRPCESPLRVGWFLCGAWLGVLAVSLFSTAAYAQSPNKNWTVSVDIADAFGDAAQNVYPFDDYASDKYERVNVGDPNGARADITHFRTGNDNHYFYFEWVFRIPWSYPSSQHAVAVEMDWDSNVEDSRGDFLVGLMMTDDFSKSGNWVDASKEGDYKFHEDRNNDVGGSNPRASDFGTYHDGYESNRGKANQTVWARVTGSGTFQVAVRREAIPDTTLLLARGWSYNYYLHETRDYTLHDQSSPNGQTGLDNMAASDSLTWPSIDPPTVEEADVGVELTVNNAIPQVGQEFTYSIAVSHVSGATARAITFEFQVPDNVVYVAHSATAGTYDPNTGAWTIGDLISAGRATLEVTVTAPGSLLGELVLAETQLYAGEFVDTNPFNNVDELEVRIAGHDGSIAWVTDLTGSAVQGYASPGSSVFVRVVDADLNLAPGAIEIVYVRLTSRLAEDEEILSLTELSADSGTFTGVIATSQGVAVLGDHELQVAAGDQGRALYLDLIDSAGGVGNLREAFIEFVQPHLVLNLSVDKLAARPGEIITYTVAYANQGALAGANLLVQQNVPRFTSYVAGSMKVGLASDTYETAFALTDAADGVEGTVNGAGVGGVLTDRIEVSITNVAAHDADESGGPDQGRVFFQVSVDH